MARNVALKGFREIASDLGFCVGNTLTWETARETAALHSSLPGGISQGSTRKQGHGSLGNSVCLLGHTGSRPQGWQAGSRHVT